METLRKKPPRKKQKVRTDGNTTQGKLGFARVQAVVPGLQAYLRRLIDPPAIDRDSLGWDARIIGRVIAFFFGKSGFVGWDAGTITSYDPETMRHTISPLDDTNPIVENLLCCKYSVFREWRFVQPEENVAKLLEQLDAN